MAEVPVSYYNFSKQQSFSIGVTLLSIILWTTWWPAPATVCKLVDKEESSVITTNIVCPIPDSDQSIMNPDENCDHVAAEWWGAFCYYYLSIIILYSPHIIMNYSLLLSATCVRCFLFIVGLRVLAMRVFVGIMLTSSYTWVSDDKNMMLDIITWAAGRDTFVTNLHF